MKENIKPKIQTVDLQPANFSTEFLRQLLKTAFLTEVNKVLKKSDRDKHRNQAPILPTQKL